MKRTKISLMLVLLLVLVTVSNSIFAVTGSIIDTTKVGSLKITALSQENGATQTNPLAGVKYSLYKVDEVTGTTVTTVEQAENAIESLEAVQEVTTNSEGVALFSNLALGRYYAKVSAIPTGTSKMPESFLVDVPMTNKDGNAWIYDIEVQPKVKVASGNAVLTKVDGANKPMQGVEFKVQVSIDNGAWQDYVAEGQTEVTTLTTDVNGQVKLENYPISINEKPAKFRLVETKAPAGYIVDNSKLDTVHANENGKSIVTHYDGEAEEPVDVAELKMVNEKPQITKKVKGNLDVASASATDTVPFNVTVDVPSNISAFKNYTITDTLPAGLTNRTNIVVTGFTVDGTEVVPADAYTKTENGKVLTIAFKPAQITKYSAISVTYDVELDMDNVVLGADGNVNTAVLEYTNKVSVDGDEEDKTTTTDTAKVVTGGVKIHKVDASNVALQGAKFKIATTEANAKAGVFVKDESGADVETTSTAEGYAAINGLAYNDDETARDYWLVETQAPTYEENGETKAYTLLDKPLKVSISGTSHTVDVTVVNKKPYNLPLTGGMGTVLFLIAGVTILVIAKSINKDEVKE